MSRISDTRERTRSAAAELVGNGRLAHEITVDLIYAEIKQGSRTTINDELKQWKDEQAKAHAMNATLPPIVADAFTRIWATAVEHGEMAFSQQREEIEQQLRLATEASQAEQQHLNTLSNKVNEISAQLQAERHVVELERQQKELLAQEKEHLRVELADVRNNLTLQLEQQTAKAEDRISELQLAMQKQEQSFAQQIEQATERLESVQKHVMLQVDEARLAHKRAEQESTGHQQQALKLSKQVQQMQIQASLLEQQITSLTTALTNTETTLSIVSTDRTTLTQQLASMQAVQNVNAELLEAWQNRALKAEQQLSDNVRPKRLQGRRRLLASDKNS